MEMIFVHCEDILEITLVCPTFNAIVSQSARIMEKLTAKWPSPINFHQLDQRSTDSLLESNRKYRRLELKDLEPSDCEKIIVFIRQHKRTLIELNVFLDLQVEPWFYFKILSIASRNLKKLTTTGLMDVIPPMDIINFPNLEEWICSGKDSLRLEGWKTPKLKKFVSPFTNDIFSFLSQLSQLRDLRIKKSGTVREFLTAASLTPFSLNLEKFNIYGAYDHIPELFPYLESQIDFLKVLSLDKIILQTDDLHRILKLKLEILDLFNISYHVESPSMLKNRTIATLSFINTLQNMLEFDITEISYVIASCSMVTTLSVEGYKISKDMSNSIVSSLHNLRTLNLSNTTFTFPFEEMDCYPSLETFASKDLIKAEWESFVEANPQLKHIKPLEDGGECYDPTWGEYFRASFKFVAIVAAIFSCLLLFRTLIFYL